MTRSCRLEIEADKQVKLRELELNAAKYAPVPAVSSIQTADALVGGESPGTTFDASKHISLVPQF